MDNLYRILSTSALFAALLVWLCLGLDAALYVVYGSFFFIGAVMLIQSLRAKRPLYAAAWTLFALVGVLAILVQAVLNSRRF